MKTKLHITYLLLLSVLLGFANNDKYRIMIMDNPSTTITIGWNQIGTAIPTLYYDTVDHGTTYSSYAYSQAVDRSVSHKGMDNRFVRLTGLSPNTNYYFVINDSDGTSQRFWFRTAPNDNSRLSFIAGGDSRNNRTPRQAANLLVSKLKPHAVFFGGDMTNNDTNSEWQDWFDDWQDTIASDGRMFPIIPARGNHEDVSDTIYNLFDTPNTDSYYALTFGNDLIRAYTLNTEISVLGNQKTWLENDLTSPSNSSVTWKMAQYHKPIKPHTAWKAENNNQYNAWAQLFYDEGVRLVVESDSHMTKTTWPVMPSSGPDNDEGFVTEQVNGTIYAGEGCWGAPLRPNDDDKSWTRNSGSFNQFKLIFVDPLKIEMRTINVNNASSVGSVSNTDPFTLPSLLDVFNPSTGDVVTINNTPDSTCPEVNTPCDDGNPNTVYSYEDGSCNCVGGLDKLLVSEYTTEVSAGSDDAEERVSSGSISLTSSDLELGNDDGNNQIVGVRFNALTLPDSATILRAYVEFVSDRNENYLDSNDNAVATNIVVEGELSINSSTYTTATSNISSRATTTNTVSWSNIKVWGSKGIDNYYAQTPNLKSVVDEIIAQPGWTNGSPIAFMFTGTGRRYAGNFEKNRQARLKIIYQSNCPILDVNLGTLGSCDDLTDTYTQDIVLNYTSPPTTGNINVNGQLFSIGTSPQTVTLTGLVADGFEVDLNAFFTDDPSCIYNKDSFFEAPTKCSLGNIPDNVPDDSTNLALLPDATVSGNIESGRGNPEDILYNPSTGNYHTSTPYCEYGVGFKQNIGTPFIDDAIKWQVNWSNVKYINYITFGGVYPQTGSNDYQGQPNTKWRISYRLDSNWIILDEGKGGWLDSGIYEWGGGLQDPIEADALRVQLYSDGSDVISVHLRGRGGIAGSYNDSATTTKATLIQYITPGNSCGVTMPANSILYCNGSWIYSDGPDENSGTKNTIIADGTYTISADSDIEINDLEILSGATLIVEEGASITVKGDLVNNGNLILESISTKYSSLIIDGTSTGNVSYKRHINAYVSGSTGNDLISSPFSGQTFGNFATANPNLYENPNNTTQKLFGPFDEPTGSYQIYSTTTNTTTTLNKGVGYRAARDASEDGVSGTTITFTGNVETGSFSIPITESTTSYNGWNLIGNPYPSYMDFDTFFNLNKAQLDLGAYQAIYGFDGDTSNGWTILNNLSTGQLIAPGQGFLVKVKSGGGNISFTPAMRVKGATDDFILGRNTASNSAEGYIKLQISNSTLNTYNTAIHFNENATLGLDPGYDAALFQGNAPELSIYSNIADNTNALMAIQAIGTDDINNTVIALGVNAVQGEEITISLSESTLSDATKVYLEDRLTNTFTLITNEDYTFTALSDISGIGRFYLRLELDALSITKQPLDGLHIYTNSTKKTIVIEGQLQTDTDFQLYDINGRVLMNNTLDTNNTIQSIDVAQLSVGIYIIELTSDANEKRTQKLIIN